jgi:hypothetical protein
MKRIAIGFLFIVASFHAYGEDNTTDSQIILSDAESQMVSVSDVSADIENKEVVDVVEEEKIWKSYIKNDVAKNVLFVVSATDDNMTECENLLVSYHYDKNKMLDKTNYAAEKVKIPHSIIHSNFVKLLQIGKKNIYVSQLFALDQKCFYFIAKHLCDGYAMFLFKLPLDFFPAENFILFDDKGQKLLNVGFPMMEVRKLENLLKNNLNNLDTLDDNFEDFSIIESNSLMYFYTK